MSWEIFTRTRTTTTTPSISINNKCRIGLNRYGVSYAKSGGMFTAKMFLEHIGYDYSESRSFPASWNEADNMLEIDIPAEYIKGAESKQGKLLAVESKKAVEASSRRAS